MAFWEKVAGFFNGSEASDDVETEDVEMTEADPLEVSPVGQTKEELKRGNKILNINATAQLQVVLVKPERYDDAVGIAEHLNHKRTVVLNLESANKDASRRILDFLSGVAFANNGLIKKVANCTFIITPYNVGVMGDLLDELENNGFYY
ncbi:MAG: cell division protein SepF [Clostridia bacterium]|nr:cell division protein SepF [Clostridia bacterium]